MSDPEVKERSDHWSAHVAGKVAKFEGPDADERAAAYAAGEDVTPDDTEEFEGNLLCNAGIQRMLDAAFVGSVQIFDNTHCRLGVGDGTTAAAATDTDLSALAGASHRQFKLMNATFPSRAGQTMSFQATFASGEANFTAGWQEWCIDNGSANSTTVSAPMLNHKVINLGIKTSASAWVFGVTVTES